MDNNLHAVARRCLDSAYAGSMNFPTIVRTLMEAGFESYTIDYRLGSAIYFLPDGDSLTLVLPHASAADEPIAMQFQANLVAEAVRQAQANGPDYSYLGFCKKMKAAGCAGYMVSFPGRRVVYFGRTAEFHTEHFPNHQ